MRALVVDSLGARGAVSAVRALALAGWEVGVASRDERDLAASSRRRGAWHRLDGPDRLIDGVNRAISQRGYDVVLPSSDYEVLTLSRDRHHVGARVPYAEHDVVERALDKRTLTALAASVGVSTPSSSEMVGDDRPKVGLVVKEAQHNVRRGGSEKPLPSLVCGNEATVVERAEEIRRAGGVPFLQERVRGTLLAFTAVADWGGRVVARAQQLAGRVWPRDSGCSVRAQTVPLDESLSAQVDALMRELRWFGLAQLQFIQPSVGAPQLIDLNGRIYGSLALAVGAGVNLPAIWAGLAVRTSLPANRLARPGVRYQWLEGDLRRVRDETPQGWVRESGDVIRYALGAKHSVWRLDDPRPAGRVVARLGKAATARAGRVLRGAR